MEFTVNGKSAAINNNAVMRYRVVGMDCPSCAADIEKAVRAVGIRDVRVSIASQNMTMHVDNARSQLPQAERAVAALGYHLERLDGGDIEAGPENVRQHDRRQSHITPQYQRALWIVILLNVGFGLIEMIGGFIARSQALKADALDFLGDGLITFLGVLAIGWSLAWRARSALIQGLFLGALGIGVLVSTAYRVILIDQPEPELMGVLGVLALVVNILAAVALIPHRTGDANVRAVWLFSRNDAIGNIAVVVAAGLVAWTGTPWPDLVVAAVIAGLFLHSSWIIVRDAQADLSEATEPTFAQSTRSCVERGS
jgi:cation diffusion facilitator family transporter